MIIMVQPIGPLMWEHRRIEKIVPILQRESAKIKELQEVDPELINRIVDFFHVYADRTHHGKEEDILFKALTVKKLESGHRKIIDELMAEHAEARSKVKRLSEANQQYKQGDEKSLNTISQMLRELSSLYPKHIEKEDRHFFHPSMNYFTQAEQSKMLEEFYEFDREMIHWKYQKVIEELGGETQESATEAKSQRYRCTVCGYIYDPERGDPEHGVGPGTSFKDIPEEWRCPVCYAAKNRFKLIGEQE